MPRSSLNSAKNLSWIIFLESGMDLFSLQLALPNCLRNTMLNKGAGNGTW